MKVTLYNKNKEELSHGYYISSAGINTAGLSWNIDHVEESKKAIYFSIDDGSLKLI